MIFAIKKLRHKLEKLMLNTLSNFKENYSYGNSGNYRYTHAINIINRYLILNSIHCSVVMIFNRNTYKTSLKKQYVYHITISIYSQQ
jgi:hypothetical protein